MVAIKGLGSSIGGTERTVPSDEEICGIIVANVAVAIWEEIPELFGSVKTTLIEKFYRCYAAIMQDAAVIATAAFFIVGL